MLCKGIKKKETTHTHINTHPLAESLVIDAHIENLIVATEQG